MLQTKKEEMQSDKWKWEKNLYYVMHEDNDWT